MLRVNKYDELVGARLLDFFGPQHGWQRRLWSVGSVLTLKEVLEASQATQCSVLSETAFKYLCVRTAARQLSHDPGIGNSERSKLGDLLNSSLSWKSSDYFQLEMMLDRVESSYLAVSR